MIYNKNTPVFLEIVNWQALGLLHSRTNLSPFTKDFRGESQQNEHLGIFFFALPSGGALYTTHKKSPLSVEQQAQQASV